MPDQAKNGDNLQDYTEDKAQAVYKVRIHGLRD